MDSYSSDQIQVLQGLEPVRKRPGMFVGDTDGPEGRHHLLWEVVGNVIDLHLAHHASELHVVLGPDAWVTVRDDGPGIPTDRDHHGTTVLESALTMLRASGTFDGHFPHVHLTPNWAGVGLAVVNALSERLEIETTYRGVRWCQAYERGIAVSQLRRIGPTAHEGTTVRFRPDPLIFREIMLDAELIRARLKELAWLNPHLRVLWQERRVRTRGGVPGWSHHLAIQRGPLECSYGIDLVENGIKVDIGLAWNQCGGSSLKSFVNMQPTIDGGAHVDGLWAAFLEHARSRKSPARRLAHVREALALGLVAVVHVGLYDPKYGSPRRDHLKSPEAGEAVKSALLAAINSKRASAHRFQQFLRERLHLPLL